MSAIGVVVAEPGQYLDEAALIWAKATAARDDEPDVAPLELARPLIERVIDGSHGALLLVAVDGGGRALGFAACAQLRDAPGHRMELRYLGVDPEVWGRGVAARLLADLPIQLRRLGFSAAELWVYGDNRRAVELYRKAGWRETSDVRAHSRSGRLERRYTLALAHDPGSSS